MSRTTYPNQRVVTIHKFLGDEKYSVLGDLAVVNAIRRMNGKRAGGFQLWSVLRMNKDGFSMRMSERFMAQGYFLQRKAYYKAMAILEESGFLVKESAHSYAFFELPDDHLKMLQRDILQFKMTETDILKCPKGSEQNAPNGDFKMPQRGRETDKEHIKEQIKDIDKKQEDQPLKRLIDLVDDKIPECVPWKDDYQKMINFLDSIGFGYSSVNGKGGVPGWLASLEKKGHSEAAVMCAAMDAVEALGPGADHVGYLMSHIADNRSKEKCSIQWAWKVFKKLKQFEFDLSGSGFSESDMVRLIYKILNDTECETKELTDICLNAVDKNVPDQIGYMMDELVNRGYSWGT